MKGLRVVISLLGVLVLGLLPSLGQAASGDISTIAGAGFGATTLNTPYGVAVDSGGNVYIADTLKHRVLKVAAGTGVVTVVAGQGTLAGTGTAGFSGDGGPATDARMNGPTGVAVDNGNHYLYIADQKNHRIRRVDAYGIITTVAGNATFGFFGDDVAATTTSLQKPKGVAVDRDGNIYIADTSNNRIRKVNVSTGIITTVAGGGTPVLSPIGDGGAATDAILKTPTGVAVDSSGILYIADSFNGNGNGCIRRVVDGSIDTVAVGTGLNQETLINPSGVAVDSAGSIYIADTYNQRILKLAVVNLTPTVTLMAGPASSLNLPSGVAVDSIGNLYVADQNNNRILKVESSLPIVTALPNGGTYTSTQTVDLTSNKTATIYYTTDGSDPAIVGGTRLSFSTTGKLTIAETTTLKFYAVDSGGNVSLATQDYIIIPPTVPNAPAAPTATAGNAQATVSFSAPAFNGGSAINGYTVTSNPAGGTDQQAGTTATTHTITGLSNGTPYTFTVAATNGIGTSADSDPSNSVTPVPPTAPGAPTAVSATAGNAQATVSFTAPASNGGASITSYTVTSSPDNVTSTGTTTSIVVSSLVNGRAYTFTVKATNTVGTGAASDPSASVTPIQKAGDCDSSGSVSIVEVQSAINMFLGMQAVSGCVDLDNSGLVTIVEVQRVINTFLGM